MGSSFDLRIWGRSYRGAAGRFRFPGIGAFAGWRNGPGRGPLVGGILLVLPGLLFLPALYYTLTTPFALIDDYAMSKVFMGIMDSREEFFRWLTDLTYRDGEYRHRPFWEFYNAATWHVLGPVPWLHHLARWVIHFGAVFAFGAALLSFMPGHKGRDGVGAWGIGRLLPLATLAYLWIFFPNQPAARLAPPGVYMALFLGLCTWMTALMLLRAGKEERRRSALLVHGVFYLSCVGLAWSRESNAAPLLWLVICYYVVLLIDAARRNRSEQSPVQVGESRFAGVLRMLQRVNRWKALGGLLLILLFVYSASQVIEGYIQGGHYVPQLTPELFIRNVAWICYGLFQIGTSPVITVGLLLLGLPLALIAVRRAVKREFNSEIIFALFLAGQFVVLYLALSISAVPNLRYWYIIIPIFTTLLAFSVKFGLEFLEDGRDERLAKFIRRPFKAVPPRPLAAWALSGFIAFFICCNYYNFLYQTVVQHSIRNDEAELLAAVAGLHNRGEYVQVPLDPGRHKETLVGITEYFGAFRPRFYGEEYDIHRDPPQESERPYYTVRLVDEVSGDLTEDYRLLAYARDVSRVLQIGAPYLVRDGAVVVVRWEIYHSVEGRIWSSAPVSQAATRPECNWREKAAIWVARTYFGLALTTADCSR